MRRKLVDQIRMQFIEAGVESGFALVDEARAYRASGQPAVSSGALLEAVKIVSEIERRLQGLSSSEAEPFLPLVIELRNEIAAVERGTP
jgi:hypothetical protein